MKKIQKDEQEYFDDNELEKYLKDISQYNLLTAEEEYRLAKLYKDQKNLKARKQLIHSNLRLVINIAKQYQMDSLELLDIIQYGNEGLIKAVDHFNPDLGNRFSTYAKDLIKKEILNNITKETKLNKVLYLDAPIDEDSENTLLDCIIDNTTNTEDNKNIDFNQYRAKEIQNILYEIFDEEDIELINAIFGLNNTIQYTKEEISKMYHLSKNEIEEIKEIVIGELSNPKYKKRLEKLY